MCSTLAFGFVFPVDLFIVFLLVAVAASIFWIVELIDVLRRQFTDPAMKLVWVLVVLFGHGLGALIYHFVGRNQGTLVS